MNNIIYKKSVSKVCQKNIKKEYYFINLQLLT